MSSARTNSRTTSNSKTASLNPHQTNGANNSYDINEATSTLTYSTGNNSKFDPSGSRSNLARNVSQYDGIYRNARFIHAMTTGLIGQQVVIQTSDHERFHGVLETLSPNADVVLTVSHRLDTNNNDILNSPTLPLDLVDTIDSSSQTFELHKRIIKASNIVELIAVDIDLSNNAKCLLDETPKVSQLEDDRFSRMQHFYGSDEIDPETLEDLELGDDGKAGFDPEDMFHTNREKFNATTDFDESKYTNVPLRALSEVELAEIEKKVQDIERRGAAEDIDEDDAGVKRPTEYSNLDEGNSNTKASRSNRNDFRIDTDYNPPKRENWRDQRSTGNTNRRGSGINSKQNQYNSTNNRQQYNNRNSRNARYTDNQSTYEQRDLTLQTTNEEPTRNQRMNSGNFSQGQTSGPTSPSGTVSGRTIYSNTHRSAAVNRNSPVPYTGSSSSRKNSVSNTTSPPNQQSAPNKITRKQSIHEQQPLNDEQDQQRNSNSLNRPSQLQTKQTLASSSTINSVSSTSGHTNQEDNSSSHGTNQSNSPNLAKANGSLNPDADEFVPVFSRESSSRPESRGGSTTSSISTNTFNQHTHPQAIHPLHSQHPTPPVIPVTHPPNPAAAALYQQYYQAQYANLAPFINATTQPMTVGVMGAPIIPSQSLVSSGANTSNSNNGGSSGMTTPNSSVSGGPTYKGNNNNNNNNNNQPHNTADNTNNTGVSNVQSKKAVVSVQRAEQPTTPQPIPGATQMVYPAPPIRFYTPEYLAAQQGTATPMAIPQFPFYYSVNPGLIPTGAGVGQPQNIMIPAGTSSAGGVATGLPTIHYPGIYADPRMYNLYASTAVNSNWQLPRSPPQQQQQQQQQPQGAEQQQQQQQRNFDANQNISNQQTSSTGASNTGNRPTSGSGQTGTANSGNSPAITPQYPLNGAIPPPFHYGAHTAWIPAPQQLSSSQANLPHQMNAAYNVIYDQIQQIPTQPQQAAYLHANAYDTSAYFAQQSQQSQQQQQQQQQQVSQQSLDTMQQGNYNR